MKEFVSDKEAEAYFRGLFGYVDGWYAEANKSGKTFRSVDFTSPDGVHIARAHYTLKPKPTRFWVSLSVQVEAEDKLMALAKVVDAVSPIGKVGKTTSVLGPISEVNPAQ